MTRKTKIILTVSLFFAIGISTLMVALARSTYHMATEIPYDDDRNYMRSEPEVQSLKDVDVKYSNKGITVSNNSDQSLSCDIIAVSGYFFTETILPPGESVQFAYKDFTYRNVRLDTGRVKPDNLSLQCSADGADYASKFRLS